MKKFIILLAVIITMISCIREEKVLEIPFKNKNAMINNDETTFNSRFVYSNQIMGIQDEPTSNLKAGKICSNVTTKNYVFTLKAEVISPIVDGNRIQATDVDINDGGFAFVSYNTQGNAYRGGIDVFNVKDINNPKIVSEVLFTDADVSAVAFLNNKLYAVGATSNDSLKFGSPAFLEVFSLNPDMKIQKVDTIIELNSQVGVDVQVDNENIYVVTGSKGGGLLVFSNDGKYTRIKTISIDNARAVSINTTNIFLQLSETGKIVQLDKTFNILKTIDIGGLTIPDSKSTITSNDNYIYTSLNEGGFSVYNTDLVLKQNIARPITPIGGNTSDYVTNAVSLNEDLVFTANGGAGISINNIIAANHDSLFSIGKFVFKDQSSCNFIKSRSNVIFVASGLGGLKILGITIDEGVPPNIIPTKPCPTLYSNIIDLFPEAKDNMDRTEYLNLFSATTTKNIITTEATDVYLTFVAENAGYKNTLGYYSYPVGNPPTNLDDIEKHVIFQNASQVNSGGGLNTGDMVRLGTTKFPANTVICFYLIADGWRNGLETQGYYTWYSDVRFNNNEQHQLLFIEKNCDDLVLTFEDMNLKSSDKDFNDVIFTISDDNDVTTANTRFDLTGIVKL